MLDSIVKLCAAERVVHLEPSVARRSPWCRNNLFGVIALFFFARGLDRTLGLHNGGIARSESRRDGLELKLLDVDLELEHQLLLCGVIRSRFGKG